MFRAAIVASAEGGVSCGMDLIFGPGGTGFG